jgi:anaerobic selenocysteine-containing dehydrogenase
MRRTVHGFEELEWDDAYDLAARGLSRVREAGGADAIALYRGNPGIHDYSTLLGANVISRALGSKNVYSAGPNDTWPRYIQSVGMYGGPLRGSVPDVDRTDYLLIVGANPLVSNGSLMTAPGIRARLAAIRKRGGKIVVIDPRRSETAQQADEHHFIRPGSDAAFLLSMIHVLFAEKLVTLGRCEELVNGLAEVEQVASRFAPERVSQHCGIGPETIRRLARELARAPSAAAYGRMGTCVQRFGTLATWATELLSVLTGNLDTPGGAMFSNPAAPLHFVFDGQGPVRIGRWRSRVSGLDEVLGEFPAVALAEEIETPGEGQVTGLVTVAGNPVRSFANSDRLDRALGSLEFMVSFDYYINETTRHADLILPPTGPLERGHYDIPLNHFAVRNVAKWSAPALDPEPGSRDAWTSSLELSRRLMGLESLELAQVDAIVLRQFSDMALAASQFQHQISLDEVLAAVGDEPGTERLLDVFLRLGPYGDGCGQKPDGLNLARVKAHVHGLDLGALTPRVHEQLATESGLVELAPERIVEDLPRLESWLDQKPDAKLRLINRRDIRSMNSWLHNLPSLAKGRERCTLQIHPDDAAKRDLEAGGVALVRSKVGSILAPVEITQDVMPGVVSLPHGFGHSGDGIAMQVAQGRPGTNVNSVTDDGVLDVPSGSTALFGTPVEVVAAPGM